MALLSLAMPKAFKVFHDFVVRFVGEPPSKRSVLGHLMVQDVDRMIEVPQEQWWGGDGLSQAGSTSLYASDISRQNSASATNLAQEEETQKGLHTPEPGKTDAVPEAPDQANAPMLGPSWVLPVNEQVKATPVPSLATSWATEASRAPSSIYPQPWSTQRRPSTFRKVLTRVSRSRRSSRKDSTSFVVSSEVDVTDKALAALHEALTAFAAVASASDAHGRVFEAVRAISLG